MYVDLTFLFLIYAFASIALILSIYAVWTLKEVEEHFKRKNSRPKSVWVRPPVVKEKPKSKGHWS